MKEPLVPKGEAPGQSMEAAVRKDKPLNCVCELDYMLWMSGGREEVTVQKGLKGNPKGGSLSPGG